MDWLFTLINVFIEFGWGNSVMLYNPQYAVVGWVVAAATVISTVSSFVGSKKAEKAAGEQSAEEAEYERKVTAESLRRLGIEERVMRGETLAGYAGGGVQASTPTAGVTSPMAGSPLVVLAEQAREFAAERKITEEVGASRVAQSLQRGKAQADAYRWSGYANVASGISNLLTGGPGGKPMWTGP